MFLLSFLFHSKVRKGVIYRLFSHLVFLFPVPSTGYNATMPLRPNLVFCRFPSPKEKHKLFWEFRILLIKKEERNMYLVFLQ